MQTFAAFFLVSLLVLLTQQQAVLACSRVSYSYNGYRLRELQTITGNEDLLVAKVEAFDRDNEALSCDVDSEQFYNGFFSWGGVVVDSVTINIRTGEVAVIESYAGISVIPRPQRLVDSTGDFMIKQDGTTTSLVNTKTGEPVTSFEYNDTYAPPVSFFISKKLNRAYIFHGYRGAVKIIDLSSTNGETLSSFVAGAYYRSPEIQNIYDEVQIAEFPGNGGLCLRAQYVFFNETDVIVIQSISDIETDSNVLLDALVYDGKDDTDTKRAYFLRHDVTTTRCDKPSYFRKVFTANSYSLVEMSISTSQILSEIDLDVGQIFAIDGLSDKIPSGVQCFSGTSLVDVVGKGHIQMKELRVGDNVYFGRDRKYYEPVYTFGHYNPDEVAEFLQIATTTAAHDKSLEISPNHMIFVNGGGHSPASAIRVGDYILNDSGDLVPVTAITVVKRKGVFAPFTPSGTIVVNGIKASTYVTLFQHNNKLTVLLGGVLHTTTGLTYQWLAHAFLLPYRIKCVRRKCEERYTSDGINIWLDGPNRAMVWLLRQDTVAVAFLGVPMVVSFWILAWTQVLASYFVEFSVLIVGVVATAWWYSRVPTTRKKI